MVPNHQAGRLPAALLLAPGAQGSSGTEEGRPSVPPPGHHSTACSKAQCVWCPLLVRIQSAFAGVHSVSCQGRTAALELLPNSVLAPGVQRPSVHRPCQASWSHPDQEQGKLAPAPDSRPQPASEGLRRCPVGTWACFQQTKAFAQATPDLRL